MAFQLGMLAGRIGRQLGVLDHYPIALIAAGTPPPAPISFDLPLNDAGAGVVNTVPASSTGSPTATFERASTAWTKLSTGLWAEVAVDVPRYSYLGSYSSAVGAAGGYFGEAARTNLLLHSNDFTNAVWAKVTMSTAKTSTGPDGVANSATRLTASGASATVLQVYVAAAGPRPWSVWVRRVTGTGTIKLFQGATKTADLASLLNTSTYVKLEQYAVVDVTVLGVGIEIGTDTDAIDVWCGQFEDGLFGSSPIPTTTVAVTREVDALFYEVAGNLDEAAGTVYGEMTYASVNDTGFLSTPMVIGALASNRQVAKLASASSLNAFDGANTPAVAGLSALAVSTIRKAAVAWGADFRVTADGVAPGSSAYNGDIMATETHFLVLGALEMAIGGFGTVRNVKIYSSALSDAELQTLTT